MSRIELNVVATGNFRGLETSIARLRTQINALNASMATGRGKDVVTKQVDGYINSFRQAIDSSGMFERHLVNVTSETTKFGRSLESGSLRLNQLFRSASDYRRGELGQIRQLAREQVRLMNATTVRLPNGKAEVIVPRGIDEAIDKQRILNQEYRIFRQVVQNGSTEIINWGKNTQWAGRQLTVGLTVPITMFGAAAAKAFMDADKQLVRLTKVYGDATKGMASSSDLQAIREQTLGLATDLASTMGVAVEETLGIAADIAATGKEGNDLIAATNEAMRLSVLGEVDRQEAMRATISIQNVFKKDSEELADSINFLNAVENQTSTSLQDLVTGIVKAGPVVQGLGGDIEDLSLMMVAMREGGISASEAANAIKSSMASLINPTKQTQDVLNGFGIDLVGIVDRNAGDVIGTLVELQGELAGLDELSRQRSIEQIFGKFQFSRINALLNNIGQVGSQTQQVMAIAGMSTQELARNAEQELTTMTESISGKFARSLESLKANLIPVGEVFVQVGTMVLNVGNKILDIFNSLPDPVKNVFNGLMILTALAGPLIMITGVLGNFFGYIVKGISTMMALKQAGRGIFEVFTPESQATREATELLTDSLFDQKMAMNEMGTAVDMLVQKLENLVQALNSAKTSGGEMGSTMANAEAAVAGRVGPATPYTTPNIKWKKSRGKYKGPGEIGAQYSHLVAGSALEKMFPNMAAGTLGMGTFVDAQAAKVQEDLKAFAPDITQLSEATVTPELRRAELTRLARIAHPTGGKAYDDAIMQIMALSEEQLAQLLPSWEKITAQTSKYMGVLSSGADAVEAGNKKAEAAMQQFEQDIADGMDPAEALTKLESSLNEADVAVEKRVKEIQGTFDRIKTEVSQISDPMERAAQTSEKIATEVIAPYEINSYEKLGESGISGYGAERGVQKALLQGAQELTDAAYNNANSTAELTAAADETNAAMQLYREALKQAEGALQNTENASNELAAAENSLSDSMSQTRSYQTGTFRKENGKWISSETGREITMQGAGSKAKQDALIAALDAREEAARKLAETELELAQKSENMIQAQQDLAEATEKLEQQRMSEIKVSEASEQAEKDDAEASEENAKAEREDAKNTRKSAVSEDKDAKTSDMLSKAEMDDAANTKKGLFRGGKMGGAISAISMASMFIPTGDPETGLGQGLGAAQDIASFAGMGAMFGAPGVAIGAGVGALKAGFDFFSRKAEESAKSLENFKKAVEASSTGLIDAERQFLGVTDRLIGAEDIPLAAFGSKTGDAISALDAFVEALKNAEDGTLEKGRVDALKATGSAQEYIQSPAFQKMISESLAAGASPEAIRSLVEGLLIASDKQGYSFEVNQELTRILDAGNTNQERLAKYLESQVSSAAAMENIPEDQRGILTQLQGEFNRLRIDPGTGKSQSVTMNGMPADIFDLGSYVQKFFAESDSPITEEEFYNWLYGSLEPGTPRTQEIMQFMSDLVQGLELDGQQAQLGNERVRAMLSTAYDLATAYGEGMSEIASGMEQVDVANALMVDNLINGLARGGQSLDEFLSSLSTGTIDTFNQNSLAIDEVKSRLAGVEVGGEEAAAAFQKIINAGANTTQALQILSMMIKDAGTDWQQLASIAASQPAVFQIVWEQYVTGGGPIGVGRTSAKGATLPENVGAALAGTIDFSGGGGSSGGSDTSGIDSQIEAQNKLIEKIKEEREERQKLLNLEKQALDFALREQDLKNQIAQAKAEGRLADAALLQSQLDAERKKSRQDEAERRRTEAEDAKIKKAQDEIKRLEDLKKGMQGGGSGGGGGVSEAKQQWTANRIDILTSGVVNWTEGAQLRQMTLEKGPWSAFFESDKVKSYREELAKLGVPAREIDRVLNEMFDTWIYNNSKLFSQTEEYEFVSDALKNMGIDAENLKQILPDAFSVLLDKELGKSEKIDILTSAIHDLGYETDESRRKAEKLYRQYNDNEFETQGIDEEIQRWIDFNDTIARARKQLKLYQTGQGGPVTADQAERTSQTAAGQTPGVPPPSVNAGGIMVDPAQIAKDAGDAGAAIPAGISAGVNAGSEEASAATGSMIEKLIERAKTILGINSPSKVFQDFGQSIIEGLSLGVTDGQGYSSINTAFSDMTDSVTELINQGFIDLPDEITTSIEDISTTFYDIMTQGIQDTVDEINNIVSTGIKDYEFKIQGMPGIYIPDNLDNFWRTALPGVYENLSNAGQIYRAQGGYVSGPGGPTEDKIAAWLSDGEYVIKAASVKKYGTGFLDVINAGRFADGGFVKVSGDTSPLGQSIADFARPYAGTPYSASAEWADGPKNGWGCATAMQWLYNQKFGINLPSPSLSAGQLAGLPNSVGRDSLLPGDLLFFYYKNGVNTQNPVNHVGMYMGNEQMFHARAPGLGTQITGIDDANYKAARRVVPQADVGLQFPRRYKNGGSVYGLGGPAQDNLLAMLSNGEYVMNSMSVRKYGKEFMDALNRGDLAEAAAGGLMSKYPGTVAKMSMGGSISRYFNGGEVSGNNSHVEYNINVNVEGSNASAEDIANKVLKAIKTRENMNRSVTRI